MFLPCEHVQHIWIMQFIRGKVAKIIKQSMLYDNQRILVSIIKAFGEISVETPQMQVPNTCEVGNICNFDKLETICDRDKC